MVKVDKFILMVMFILVNGKIIMLMVKEFNIIGMARNKDMVNLHGLMVHLIKVI